MTADSVCDCGLLNLHGVSAGVCQQEQVATATAYTSSCSQSFIPSKHGLHPHAHEKAYQ